MMCNGFKLNVILLFFIYCLKIKLSECLMVGGIEVPHALPTYKSKVFENWEEPKSFPYSQRDLTPDDDTNDQLF